MSLERIDKSVPSADTSFQSDDIYTNEGSEMTVRSIYDLTKGF